MSILSILIGPSMVGAGVIFVLVLTRWLEKREQR